MVGSNSVRFDVAFESFDQRVAFQVASPTASASRRGGVSEIERMALIFNFRADRWRRVRLVSRIRGEIHHAVIVGVGLIKLEHRELRVVMRGDAFVAEVAIDFVDPLQAADDQRFKYSSGAMRR